MEINFRSDVIRRQMSKSTKVVPCIFFASSKYFRDINASNFLPRKVGQGHRVTFSKVTSFDGKCQNLHFLHI